MLLAPVRVCDAKVRASSVPVPTSVVVVSAGRIASAGSSAGTAGVGVGASAGTAGVGVSVGNSSVKLLVAGSSGAVGASSSSNAGGLL